MRYYLAALVATVAFGVPWLAVNDPVGVYRTLSILEEAGHEVAAVILSHNPVTVADLRSAYSASTSPSSQRKVVMLVVPGHEPDYGGAEYQSPFGDIKERDLTVKLSQDLAGYLDGDSHFQVFTTRDQNGWTPAFADYFKNDWDAIVAWQQANKSQFMSMVDAGDMAVPTTTPSHDAASSDVATRLYGIDKWADDNGVDIAIHIHFNDYPGHGSAPGTYDGFAIYVPAGDYANASTTNAVADKVFARLSKYDPVSNWAQERAGIIPDQDLIATGSFDTVNAPSMLIEYSYIYEPQLDDPAVQDAYIKDLAYQTYLGIRDFFDPVGTLMTDSLGTTELPYKWSSPMSVGSATTPDIFALQTALIADGDYPPAGMSMNDCPRTGKFGPCTKSAVIEFQQKYGITGAAGNVDLATIVKLNELF